MVKLAIASNNDFSNFIPQRFTENNKPYKLK